MKLRQHVPTFVDGVTPKRAEGSLAAILGVPWVAEYLTMCDGARFMADLKTLLVDGMRNGKRWWWVVGFFDESPRGLPVMDYSLPPPEKPSE